MIITFIFCLCRVHIAHSQAYTDDTTIHRIFNDESFMNEVTEYSVKFCDIK